MMRDMLPTGIDGLDAQLILALAETPRAGVMELARRLERRPRHGAGEARQAPVARDHHRLRSRSRPTGARLQRPRVRHAGDRPGSPRRRHVAPRRHPRGARSARHDRSGGPPLPGRRPHQRAPARRDQHHPPRERDHANHDADRARPSSSAIACCNSSRRSPATRSAPGDRAPPRAVPRRRALPLLRSRGHRTDHEGGRRRACAGGRDRYERQGSLDYDELDARMDRARQSAAALCGVPVDDLAFVKNTTEGLGFVASGLQWQPGDRVVVPDREFPSTIYPWLALRELGVQVDLVTPEGDSGALTVDAFESVIAAGPAPKVVATSWVHYGRGWRTDLAATRRRVPRRRIAAVRGRDAGRRRDPSRLRGVERRLRGRWVRTSGCAHPAVSASSTSRRTFATACVRSNPVGHRSRIGASGRTSISCGTGRRSASRADRRTRRASSRWALRSTCCCEAGVDRIWAHVDRLCDRLVDGLQRARSRPLAVRSLGRRTVRHRDVRGRRLSIDGRRRPSPARGVRVRAAWWRRPAVAARLHRRSRCRRAGRVGGAVRSGLRLLGSPRHDQVVGPGIAAIDSDGARPSSPSSVSQDAIRSGSTNVSPLPDDSVTRNTRVASVSCTRFHVAFHRGVESHLLHHEHPARPQGARGRRQHGVLLVLGQQVQHIGDHDRVPRASRDVARRRPPRSDTSASPGRSRPAASLASAILAPSMSTPTTRRRGDASARYRESSP